ncbi:MAG: GNAT family N-acetyltransferase [Proteobacteria bacterium]|nr:MAG: GNAT family N-acetyltransferase [Pseudomonadota bacterium]
MTKTLRIAHARDDAPFAIRHERATDAAMREALLDAAFGAGRHARTCQRLREGRLPADGLAFTATRNGRLIGTVRLWNVAASGAPFLMLGPLAVDPACRSLGLGAVLMTRALAEAHARGHAGVVLLGDAPYYARFGFSAEKTGALFLPGPFERERLLGCELQPGALEGARGVLVATGRRLRHAPLSRAA